MCRFFGYIGEGRHVKELIYALVSSAGFDPLMRSRFKRHGDGWGYVLYTGERLSFGKCELPIYRDVPRALEIIPKMTALRMMLVMHARAAGKGQPLGLGAAHPFMGEVGEGGLLFLAHNGSVKKDELAKHLGLSSLTDLYPDSYFLFKALQKYEDPASGLPDLFEFLSERGWAGRGSNVIAIWLRPDGAAKLMVYPWHEEGDRYYEMYMVRPSDGSGEAFVSSTIAYKLSEGWEKEKLKPKHLVVRDFS